MAFYVLALGIALGLIAAPIAIWATTGRGNVWVALAMVGAGVAILRAIVPERDRFEPPGPELRREEQPRLHKLVDAVAAEVGERPPDAVYLDLPVNASVLEHRRRRVMLLGLPLLVALDADELKAVIAHEYAHYTGGDTRFAGWIWRTRVAVLKTVHRLEGSDSWFRRNVVRWPFRWYAALFLRITNAVSRRAEFQADALSARVASPEAAGRALRRLEAIAPAFDLYWQSDVIPMLESELRPPITGGFRSIAENAELAAALDDVVHSDIEALEPDAYASHPTLRQRLEALGVPVEAAVPEPVSVPASGLLENLPELEELLLREHFGEEVESFRVADWSESAAVHLKRMRESSERFATAFPNDLTVASTGTAAADLPARRDEIRRLLAPEDRDVPEELLDDLLLNVLGGMVVATAEAAGATITAPPGEPLRIAHPAGTLDPWELLGEIAAGRGDQSGWTEHPVVQALGDRRLRAGPKAPSATAR